MTVIGAWLGRIPPPERPLDRVGVQQRREVMARATENLDLTEVFATLDEWRRIARLTAAAGACVV